ncbi:MAG: Sua5/YciO/YrdC/YwlC family protein [Anaerolineales bacterium]
MNTVVIPADSPDAIDLALDVLNNSGLVAFPTDTVYGVGALVYDGAAVESIYIAQSPSSKSDPRFDRGCGRHG